MKLLHVITSMNPKTGGPCQGIRNLNPYLRNEGFEIDVVTFDENNADYEDDFRVFKVGKGKTPFYYQPQFYNWLISNIENYDFISVHGIWQYHNYAVYRAIKYLKKKKRQVPKVIIMPHGMLDPYFQKAETRKFKAIRNNFFWSLIEKKAINAADAIFFTCEEELLLARTTFIGYKPKKEINVGYGIQHPPKYTEDMRKAFYNLCPNLKERPYWLFLSRIHPKKGIDDLINAYIKLTLKYKNLPHLVIAGSTDSSYAKKMIQFAENHPQIHFSGMLNGDKKWGAFYNCDAFVLPSYQENFGIAVAEAMACKKTVVITKHINIWNEINQGEACVLFDDNGVDSIYKSLEFLCNMDSEHLKRMGDNAYKIFLEHFYIEKTAKRFAQTLYDLVK